MIQLQVLNYILDTKDSDIITSNKLTNKFFPDYKKEFDFINNHLEQFHSICDKTTFLSVFSNFEVIAVNESKEFLIKELYNNYNNLKLTETFSDIKQSVLSGDIEKAVETYRNGLDKFISTSSYTCVDLFKDKTRYNDFVERLHNPNKYYVATGFKEIDAIMGGIDRTEDLGCIFARTNIGKSWLLEAIAMNCSMHHLKVGYYSGEMSERKVGYRFDTLYGHINNSSLNHGNVDVQNDYRKYIDNLPQDLSFKVITPQMIGGLAGVKDLKEFIIRENLDILFIDQYSLLKDDRGARDPVTIKSNISTDLKTLQTMYKIPIIAVVQQNRTKLEDENMLDASQIAGSDKIGQDATWVLGITRDKKDANVLHIHFVKNRDGSVGKIIDYYVDYNTGKFTYIPSEDDANSGVTEKDYASRYSSNDDIEKDILGDTPF